MGKAPYLAAAAAAVLAGGSFLGYHALRGNGIARVAQTPATPVSLSPNSPNATPTETLPHLSTAKPLTPNIKKGLDWLASTQLDSGGWGQGEEAAGMRGNAEQFRDVANVADTCAAALALMRAGSTPTDGPHAQNIGRAIDFICAEIEKSDTNSMDVTQLHGTRLQSKLGPHIDTFLAALLLAEVRNAMPDEPSTQRVVTALAKVMGKIGQNQKDDGSFNGGGWAPVLAQAMCSKALNRAAQNGQRVDEKVRERAEQYARAQYDEKNQQFAGGGSAGVELYSVAGNLGAMKDSNDTNVRLGGKYRDVLASPTTSPADRAAAETALRRFDENHDEMQNATAAVTARLQDKQFLAGFGSNGGEEFLSYMNIGETLVSKGGEEWEKWDKSIGENLNRVQNDDGSWSGQHCITGRTFCTSAAVLALTVDRATDTALALRVKSGDLKAENK